MTRPPRRFVPAITPLAAGLSVDTPRFAAFCRQLRAAGADSPAVFATRSEATSRAVAEGMGDRDCARVRAPRVPPGEGLKHAARQADALRFWEESAT